MKARLLLIVAILFFLPALLWAETEDEEQTIAALKIEGLKRVEEASVRAVISSQPGRVYNPKSLGDDIRSVFKMGYFTDVRVERKSTPQGPVLIFQVEEKPSVKEVRIEGNDDVSKDDINAVIDIKPFSVLSYDKIYRNMEKIQNVYVDQGFFLAEVDYALVTETNNQVSIVFKINEHAKVEVKKIIILGNDKIADKDLREIMMTKPGDLLSFLTKAGQYRRELVERDAWFIGNYYADRGYLHAKVATPQVAISPDKKYIYVTFSITEGEQYKMGDLAFSGDLLFPKERLEKAVTLKKGQIFNRSQFLADMERVSDLYKDLGYAFANVVPMSTEHDQEKTVDINMQIQKGQKVWIEQINVVGNTKTRDKVIRREMRIAEGDLYSSTGIARSKRRIYQLGYFETVEITENPGSGEDKIVLNVELKERRTGTFQIGFGFSSIDSFMFQAQVNQPNLLGRGQNLGVQAQLSSTRTVISLSFFEPYLLDSKVNFGFKVYNQSITYPRQGDFGNYSRKQTGFDLTLGYPILDDFSLFLTYSLKKVDLDVDKMVHLHLFKSGLTSSLQFAAQYDTRDNRLFPTDGMLHVFTLEYADKYTGSDIKFLELGFTSQYFIPVYWKLVFKINLQLGYILSLEKPNANIRGRKDFPGVPVAERFLLGGIQSIRGYEYGSISPTIDVISQDDPAGTPVKYRVGGNKQFLSNFELEFPLIEAAGLRWVFFFDAGNTWSEQQQFFYLGQSNQDPYNLPLGLYMSYGFGFRWYSPIGPLRFEWGLPITKRPQDKDIAFEFSIGNQF